MNTMNAEGFIAMVGDTVAEIVALLEAIAARPYESGAERKLAVETHARLSAYAKAGSYLLSDEDNRRVAALLNCDELTRAWLAVAEQ